MRTFIFCTSFINGDPVTHTLGRYERWVKYYSPLLDELQAERMFLIDDGGKDYGDINVISGDLPAEVTSVVNVYRFEETLGRRSVMDFPGWWRSFLFSIEIARKYGYDRIIHIESDFFILSDRLKEYIKNLENGWISMYSDHYSIPETGIQVICKDAFDIFTDFKEKHLNANYQMDQYAELILPFTHVNSSFIGDRLGNKRVINGWINKSPALLSRLDYIGQV